MENGKCPEFPHTLKIKIKSLAAEARIIRQAERKFKGPHWGPSQIRLDLHKHRTHDIRREQRSSLLAYGFLRGVPYKRIEEKAKSEPRWAAVCAIAERFSGEDKRIVRQRFFSWAEQEDPDAPKGILAKAAQKLGL